MKKYESPICDLLVWSATDLLMDSIGGDFGLNKDILGIFNGVFGSGSGEDQTPTDEF